MQLLFLVGNDAWASSEDTKEILQLLGCPKALSTVDILWVRRASAGSLPSSLSMADLSACLQDPPSAYIVEAIWLLARIRFPSHMRRPHANSEQELQHS